MAYSIKLTRRDGSTVRLPLIEGTAPHPKELVEVNIDGRTVRMMVEMVVAVERLPGEKTPASVPPIVYAQELR